MLVPLILYWVTIFVATHVPGTKLPDVRVGDKLEHFLGFFLLAVLLCNEASFWTKARRSDWLVLLIVAVYAAGDEWTQSFVGRQTDVMDWYADMAGAGAAVALWGLARSLKHRWTSRRRVRDINELATTGCNVDQKLDAPASSGRF
jgi:VanZ family protein